MIEVNDGTGPRHQPSGRPQPAVDARRTGPVTVTGTIRRILWVLPLPLVTVVAAQHRSVPAEGFAQLGTARWPWCG
ncbi:hypothetical protein [Streptomyces griseoloalbus]|uniref:Uncharacterized protein n=1 Tax=Streptomyces griseoloalbus TaxID=67303 RepID=A0A7W8BML6_9ACTN|nr:hypothetical protein [Streptomyces albaduncus]MBB5125667.1 hypothetical protein [Streptomyces albaduncus]GGW56108.1 hypothetical protein GCM10010340_38400 [Streptomyces albaduncus]